MNFRDRIFSKIKKNDTDKELLIDNLFENKRFSLLEVISILKFKACKDKEVNKIDIMNMINRLRVLVDELILINETTAKDMCMNFSFELGFFCNEFNLLCEKLSILNPLKDMNLQEVCNELYILSNIDKEYFCNVDTADYRLETFENNYYEIKIYDSLFYLKNHCVIGIIPQDINLEDVFKEIDTSIDKLKEFISNRKQIEINEDLAFYIGSLIESLATIAYDYDIPNKLTSTFNTSFTDTLDTLDLALKQIYRFKEEVNKNVVKDSGDIVEDNVNFNTRNQ